MRTSIWIENGMTQLVLTPENDWEKNVTGTIATGQLNSSIYKGCFYECAGGWVRQGTTENSLIIKVDCRADENDRCSSKIDVLMPSNIGS